MKLIAELMIFTVDFPIAKATEPICFATVVPVSVDSLRIHFQTTRVRPIMRTVMSRGAMILPRSAATSVGEYAFPPRFHAPAAHHAAPQVPRLLQLWPHELPLA